MCACERERQISVKWWGFVCVSVVGGVWWDLVILNLQLRVPLHGFLQPGTFFIHEWTIHIPSVPALTLWGGCQSLRLMWCEWRQDRCGGGWAAKRQRETESVRKRMRTNGSPSAHILQRWYDVEEEQDSTETGHLFIFIYKISLFYFIKLKKFNKGII